MKPVAAFCLPTPRVLALAALLATPFVPTAHAWTGRHSAARGLPDSLDLVEPQAAGQDLTVDLTNPGNSGAYSVLFNDIWRNVAVGNPSVGTLDQFGATFNVTGALVLGDGTVASVGTYNLRGSSILNAGRIIVGNFGAGVLNLFADTSGNLPAAINVAAGSNLVLAQFANSAGTVNLNGGVLSTPQVFGGGGASTFNFNGGLLRASANDASASQLFFSGVRTVNVQAGGARVDTAGFNVTVASNLVHDAALTDPDGGLVKTGAGTLTLSSNNSYTGTTNVNGGILSITGSLSGANLFNVGAGGTLNVSGGGRLVLADDIFQNDQRICYIYGDGATSAQGSLSGANSLISVGRLIIGSESGNGVFIQTGGTLTTNGNDFELGRTDVSAGTYNLSGGTLSTGNATVGLSGSATFTQSGGTFTTNGKSLSIGAFTTASTPARYILSGGNLTTAETDVRGQGAPATFLQTGGVHVTDRLSLGGFRGNAGIYNLNGGTLLTNLVAPYDFPFPQSLGTSIFNFNGGLLQARQDNAGFLQGITTANVQAGGARINTAGFNITIAQPLRHDTTAGAVATDGGLTKLGAGTLTLSGTNTYTGDTTVSEGTLAVTGSVNGASPGALNVDGAPGAPAPTLSLSGANSGFQASFAYIGRNGDGRGNQSGGSFTVNGVLNLGYLPGGNGTYTLSGGSLLTSGTQVSNDANTSTFTQSGGTHTTGSVTLTGYSSASVGTYNLDGGTLVLRRVDSGNNGVSGTSTFNFNGGTLQALGNNAAFLQGLTTANVRAGGAVINTDGFNVTIAQNLVHDTTANAPATDGGLTKLRVGALTLTGANTYTGTTSVLAGALFVNNATGSGTGSGAVVVGATGAGLGGSGTIGGSVTVGSVAGITSPTTAALSPGPLGFNSAGVLTINGNLTLNTRSIFEADLGGLNPGAGGYDQVRVGGLLTLGGTLDLNLRAGFTPTLGDTFYLFDNTGLSLVSGRFANVTPGAISTLGTFTDGTLTYLVNYADRDPTDFSNLLRNDVSLTVINPIPEPGTWLLLAAGGVAGLGRAVRHRGARRHAGGAMLNGSKQPR